MPYPTIDSKGFSPDTLDLFALLHKWMILQFGVVPNRLTLSIPFTGETIRVFLIGLADWIKNKKASPRPKDAEDLKFLQRAK